MTIGGCSWRVYGWEAWILHIAAILADSGSTFACFDHTTHTKPLGTISNFDAFPIVTFSGRIANTLWSARSSIATLTFYIIKLYNRKQTELSLASWGHLLRLCGGAAEECTSYEEHPHSAHCWILKKIRTISKPKQHESILVFF